MSTPMLTRAAIALTLATLAPVALAAQHASHDHGAQRGTQAAATKPASKPTTPTVAKPAPKPATRAKPATGTSPAAKRDSSKAAAAITRSAKTSAAVDSVSRTTGHEHHPGVVGAVASVDSGVTQPQRLAETRTMTTLVDSGAHAAHAAVASTSRRPAAHDMWMRELGKGWQVMGMAQVFPTMTAASTRTESGLLSQAGLYATQPAVMFNVASPAARFVLRTTLNFEDLTQENGELTYGGWGEGFIDARHPHTLLHEAMLTANLWDVRSGALSISAGKGFAPYGTDDPMGRPAVKFPTNHHLSQVLERFTVNGAYLWNGWGLEAGIFGGAEPESAYDFSNIKSFGDSWSARVSKRFGDFGPFAQWELSTSFASIDEEHHGEAETTELVNGAVRHAQAYGFGRLYALVEGSRSNPERVRGHWAVLGETRLELGRGWKHQPYLRTEYATRPEYEREGEPGTPEFFRYEHGAHEIGATRWLINTIGYGYETSTLPVSVRPYLELQHNLVGAERGGIDPKTLYGDRSFLSVSAGARVFFGGGAMRMGSYGALDPMSAAMRPGANPHGTH